MVEVLGGRAHTTGEWSWLLKKREGARGTRPYTLCGMEADEKGKRTEVSRSGVFRKYC